MTVGHFMVESTGTLSELDRVKLSGRVPGHSGIITWAGNSLAILTGELCSQRAISSDNNGAEAIMFNFLIFHNL